MCGNIDFDSYVKEYGLAKTVRRQTETRPRRHIKLAHLRHSMTQARLTLHVAVINPKGVGYI